MTTLRAKALREKTRIRHESARFVVPSLAAIGLLGGCSSAGWIDPGLDNLSSGGEGALHAVANDPGAHHLSGTLSGFWGPCEQVTCGNTLVLQNNGGDDLTLSDNGVFTFARPLWPGQDYAVTVLSQPRTIVGLNGGQTCVVSAGAGDVGGHDVTDVVVNCTTNSYSIGGKVSGLLAGAEVLLSSFAFTGTAPKGGNRFTLQQALRVTGDGSPSQTFTFQTPVMASSNYSVSVQDNPQAPLAQSCALAGATAQGFVQGSVIDANITNLELTCTTLP